MNFGKVGWTGQVIWSSESSVIWPKQMNKDGLLGQPVRTLFSCQNRFPDTILKFQKDILLQLLPSSLDLSGNIFFVDG